MSGIGTIERDGLVGARRLKDMPTPAGAWRRRTLFFRGRGHGTLPTGGPLVLL